MTATIKGVRKPNSKLNFASQPFAFCEYVFAERGGRYTVTGAYLHDGFFALRSDVERFYCACAVTEILDRILVEESEDAKALFIATAECLKTLSLSDGDTAEPLLTFCQIALNESGYMLDLNGCGHCGSEIGEVAYFDFDTGSFCCSSCGKGVRASLSTYHTLRSAAGLTFDEKKAVGGKKRALRLLKAYLSEKTEGEYPCFSEFIRLYEDGMQK